MKRIPIWAIFLAIALSISPPAVLGQTSYGSVIGTVRDASQAAIPGAQVALTNADTGLKTTRETNVSGVYVFPNVPPGNYTVTLTAKGFATAQEPVFAVRVNDTQTHDFALRVGSITESVEVHAEAAMLQQSTSELGMVVN